MDAAGRKRKIETRGECAQDEENKKKQASAQLGRVHCNYCKRNISDQIYIKSAASEDVDLCLECFSVGVEIKDVKKTDGKHPHRNNCNYRVMERLDFPIIVDDWSAREELALLDGIDTYGIGNWKQVSDIVGTKDERECEYHYFAYYINTASGAPAPDVSKAVSKTQFIKQEKHVFDECIEAAIAGAGKVPGKLTKSEWKKHMIETKGITRENIKYYDDKPPGSDVVGFMPARGDMDMEWENDSEALICECSFDDKKDTEQDKELKMKVLEAYNWKLEERIRRKQFIIDRNLLDYKKQHSQERRRAKDEREMWQEMRQFARFWPQEEHEEFMRWLIHENKIRKRVQQLQSWRKAGLHTFADGDSYELHKAKKEMEDKQKRAKTDTSGYILAPKAGAAQRSERLRMRNEDDFGELDMMQPSLNPGAKKPGAYEIAGMAGSELLGKGEADVCRSQRVSPLDYIQAKEAMIRQSVLSGSLKVGAAKLATPKLDPAKATKIHEFMVNAGWITATMGGEGSL